MQGYSITASLSLLDTSQHQKRRKPFGGEASYWRNHERAVSLKVPFVRPTRRSKCNAQSPERLIASEPGNVLNLAQFTPEPELICRAVIDENRIASSQVLFVVFPNFGFVTFEHWMENLRSAAEQEIYPRFNRIQVPLVVNKVQLNPLLS